MSQFELLELDDPTEEYFDTRFSTDDFRDLVVFSRDWTVETILSQVLQGNIDLSPEFQRRNAWNDKQKSKLVESLIIGFPVPEIVLAEHPEKKRSFVVLDGKQRLLALAGFLEPTEFNSWNSPKLRDLQLYEALNGYSYNDLNQLPQGDVKRFLDNASLRCTIVSNYQNEDIVYDIFSRLNTGSVPLTTQELRQAIIRGEFSNFLLRETDQVWSIHKVLKLDGPDRRMVDTELLLRMISFSLFWENYRGTQKSFLDDTMKLLNRQWATYETQCTYLLKKLDSGIEKLKKALGGYECIGRKDINGNKTRFNRALFEAQVLLFAELPNEILTPKKNKVFVQNFKKLCEKSSPFRASIESSTQTLPNYDIRFSMLSHAIQDAYNIDIKHGYDFSLYAK